MNTHNEQLRKDFYNKFIEEDEDGIHLYENTASGVNDIFDWFLSKFAAHDAELVRRVRREVDYWNNHAAGTYKDGAISALNNVLDLLRHTGEDNQNER